MTLSDLTGDGRSDLVVTSPWGLGVIGWNGQSLASAAMCQNGSRIGDWALDTAVNRVQLTGDLDGDGRHEVLLSSPWGIGVAAFTGGSPVTKAMAANGTRLGGWIVDTANNRFLHAVDVDADGRAELVVTSPWGLGLLALRGGSLTSVMLAANGTRFGGWLLNTADNWFPVAGDLDGDGRAELVVTSPWGLGILRFDGTTLASVVMAPNGTAFGSWSLNTATDRVEAAADVDGDGRAELVLSGPGGLLVLDLDGAALTVEAAVADGASAGSWIIDALHDGVLAVGDVDGDGRAELVVRSDDRMGVLGFDNGQLQSQLVAANGTHFGGWNLNTADNRIALALDIDGDGKDEVVVTSPWGLGILRLGDASGGALMLAPNGTHFGDWNLNIADNDWLSGRSHTWGVILHHPDWGGAVTETQQVLRDRGYTVLDTDSADQGKELLSRLARVTRAADRVFVYLAGHGGTSRAIGDYSREVAFQHIIQFGDGGILSLNDIAPSFELMADKGAEVSVFDGSCDAGESVIAAIGERYVALSTTGAQAPGLTDTPSPGAVMKTFGQPSRFGLWWLDADSASLLTGNAPHRFYQKVYRSDTTEVAQWSVHYKTAVSFSAELAASWDLVTRNCYLFQYVYADLYHDPNPSDEVVAYKAATKVSLDDYLASMQADHDGFEASITKLRGILGDSARMSNAGNVYAAAFPRPWLTTTGDLGWNVVLEPVKTFDDSAVLSPMQYSGAAGFAALVHTCIQQLDAVTSSWQTQKTRLHQLDEKVRPGWTLQQVRDVSQLREVFTISQQLKRSRFDEERRVQQVNLLTALRSGSALPLPALTTAIAPPPVPGAAGAPAALRSERFVRTPAVDARASSAVSPHLAPPRAPLPTELLSKSAVDVTALSTPIAQMLGDVVGTWVTDKTAAEIIADIRATELSLAVTLSQLHYHLTIVEEALSRAEEAGAQRGDLIAF